MTATIDSVLGALDARKTRKRCRSSNQLPRKEAVAFVRTCNDDDFEETAAAKSGLMASRSANANEMRRVVGVRKMSPATYDAAALCSEDLQARWELQNPYG